MDIQNQFFNFYKPYLKKTAKAIENGKSIVFVGINAIGKHFLAEQILSKQFRNEFFTNKKIKIVFLNFKNKHTPDDEQLYRYWITETAQSISFKVNFQGTYNIFSFYSLMSEILREGDRSEKICFLIQDAQNVIDRKSSFYEALIYLHRYSPKKISYILLSEPQILSSSQKPSGIFIQHFIRYRYEFLKYFNLETTLADIKLQEKNFNRSFKKYYSIIAKYSQGYHGLIGAFCMLINDHAEIKTIRRLIKIFFENKLCRYWVEEVLQSLPSDCLTILKKLNNNPSYFSIIKNDLNFHWLVSLGLVKKNGELKHSLFKPLVDSYRHSQLISTNIKFINNKFSSQNEEIKVSKKELLILRLLYQKRGRIVSYDEIGDILWGKNSAKFSIWSISQLIRRLRKKLTLYKFDPKVISVFRGKGYSLNKV